MFILIGFLMVPAALYLIWEGWNNLTAVKELKEI